MEPVRNPAEVCGELAAPPPPSRNTDEPDLRGAVLANIQASYFFLRRGMAFLAIALPVILWFGGGFADLQSSMSAYYHFDQGLMRDVFVGGLWAIGALLFLYKGYSRQEDWALNLAGLFSVMVALFPMDWPEATDQPASTSAMIHGISAVGFFLAIAYVAIFRAKDTLLALRDPDARRRYKRSYATVGWIMICLPVAISALHWLAPQQTESPWVFFVEVSANYAFAAFWLLKSREIAAIEKQG